MSKSPEKLDKEHGDNKPWVLSKIKTLWWKMRDWIYGVFGSVELEGFWETYMVNWKIWIVGLTPPKYDYFMLCWNNHIWAAMGNTWRLLNKQWEEMKYNYNGITEVFEVDYVKRCSTYVSMKWSVDEWDLYKIWSKWWMVANDWTIVPAEYDKMYHIGDTWTKVVWIKKQANWKSEAFLISTEDWSISEYDLPYKFDDSEESDSNIDTWNGFHEKRKQFKKEIKDTLYNKVLKENFELNKGWKKWKFRTYMLDWKVWIEWVLEPEYEDVEPCSENYIWVRKWEKRWLVDVNGKFLIDPEFDRVFENTYEMDDKRWFINENGEALECKYDLIVWDNVMVGNKMWLVDRKTGREIIEPKYNYIQVIRWYSLAKVWLGKKCWLLSTVDWSVIKEVEYDVISRKRKECKLLCMKWHNVVDEVDYSIYKDKKADS